MQNLGPAQVETLYRNTRKGDSLCDLVTAELLGITTMVKGMIGCEHSQNLADHCLLTSCPERTLRNSKKPESMMAEETLGSFKPPSGKNGVPTGAQPLLLARMQVSLQDDIISSTLIHHF